MRTLHENSVIILLCDSHRSFQIGLHFHCPSSQQFCLSCCPWVYEVYKNIFAHGIKSVADRYWFKLYFFFNFTGSLIIYLIVKIPVF
jgi:hypothetical protein